MADVRTGQLRERVQIYVTQQTTTPAGGTTTQDIIYWDTYAKVSPMTSAKTLQANQEVLRDGFYITIRYRKDKTVNKSLKMLYRGKWLHLTSLISDDVRKEYVTFMGTYKEVSEEDVRVLIQANPSGSDKPYNFTTTL